ncbi:MAG: hypothetical protein IT427_03255 [Pirellulales bacterium]|nr:hypothetical protein [Pirellulales bacterium]
MKRFSITSRFLRSAVLRVAPAIVAISLVVLCNGATTKAAPTTSDRYLSLLDNFIGWAQQHWNESEQAFDAAGSGVSWPRGNGNICVAGAVLLTERPDQKAFSPQQIPRDEIEGRIRQTIRTMCLSNRNCKHRDAWKQPRWGGPSWQVGLETSGWLWAAWLLRDRLDDDTWNLAQQVAAAEAELLKKEIPSRVNHDTGAEDCIWNAAMMGAAANFLGDDDRAQSWDEWCKRWALNALSRKTDRNSERMVDGKPLSKWLRSTNVHHDLTLENHGFWSIPYQAEYGEICEAILAYHLCGKKIPDALVLHDRALWNDVLVWLTLCDGDLLCPQGQDWAPRDFQQIWVYALMSTFHKFPSAMATEARALDLLTARQKAFHDGSIHANNFGYETHLARHWSICLLMHKCFDGVNAAAGRDRDEVFNSGSKTFPYVKVAVLRSPSTVSSVSWSEARQTILVVPHVTEASESASSFTDYNQRSGVGWIQLRNATKPLEFHQVTEPIIARSLDALTVSFDRTSPGKVKQEIGYVALCSGEVVVFSRWLALGEIQVAEVVSHPFYWLSIDRFLPGRSATENSPGCWSIGDRLQVQIIGGAGGRIERSALLGSANNPPQSYHGDEIIESSVAIYQPMVAHRPLLEVRGSRNEVVVGETAIRWEADGTITLRSKSN